MVGGNFKGDSSAQGRRLYDNLKFRISKTRGISVGSKGGQVVIRIIW